MGLQVESIQDVGIIARMLTKGACPERASVRQNLLQNARMIRDSDVGIRLEYLSGAWPDQGRAYRRRKSLSEKTWY